MNYEINLTETQDAALGYVSVSKDDWIQHVVLDRCRVAIDEIVGIAVTKCLETNMQIPGTREEIVELAFAQGWVKSAAQREAEFQAEMAARQAAQQE